MFKFFLGIILIIVAVAFAMTGAGIILAIPFALIGLFLAIWGFIAMIGSGAKGAVSVMKAKDTKR